LVLIPVVLVLALAAAQPAFAATTGQSNITITGSASTSNITKSSPASGTVTWTANADNAVVNIADLAGATGLGTYDVVLDTANAAGTQTGDLSNPAGNPINTGSTKNLTLKSAGVTTLDSPLTTSGNLYLDGTGTAAVNQPLSAYFFWAKRPLSVGTSITTSHNQQYDGGPVTLTANATLTSTVDSLMIYATVDGAYSLTLSGKNIGLSDFIGAGTPLTSITANASLQVWLSHGTGATVHTTGDQSYSNLQISNNAQTVRSDSGTISLTGALDVTTRRLVLDGKGSIPGVVAGTGAGGIDFTGPGPWVVGGADTYPGGTTVTNSILRVNGTIGAVTLTGSTLGGTGTVGNVSGTSSTLSPGASPGKLTTGNLALTSNSSVVVELNGTSPGTGYDQIAVNGTVDLGGATLVLTASTFPHVGSVFRIIDNDGTDPVMGTFSGLPEGSFVDMAGARLRVSYVGGTGNDVTLTPVKQAPTIATSSSPDTVVEGSPFDVSATVGGRAGAPTPTGSVTFSEGGTTLGSATLSNGVATLHVPSLPAGHHDLTATYSGNGDFEAGSTGLIREIAATPPSSSVPPTISGITISVADASGKESDPPKKAKKGAKKAKPKTVLFVVRLSGASDTPVTVNYATKDGTAKAGRDYKRTAGKLTFKPGVTKLTIAVPIVPDKEKEKLERFTLAFSGPVGATLAKAAATGTIKDNG
jgi:hypothetical protein